MQYRWIIWLLALLLPIVCLADHLIIEPDMGREPILKAINHSKQSIQLVMYGLTDKTLLQALLDKHRQGQTVQVILERKPYKNERENAKAKRAFNKQQIPWRGQVKPFNLIHQKTLIIDGDTAIVMTFNFTQSAFKNQRNFALILDDPSKVTTIRQLFSADWNHLPISLNNHQLLISPDNAREKLSLIIRKAKYKINIYAQTIKDYDIVGELAKSAQKGVQIRILTSSSLDTKPIKYLQRKGVVIKKSKRLYIHAKALTIDDKLALVGSQNLTRNSLDHNRELSAITLDPTCIRLLNQTFDADWQQATR